MQSFPQGTALHGLSQSHRVTFVTCSGCAQRPTEEVEILRRFRSYSQLCESLTECQPSGKESVLPIELRWQILSAKQHAPIDMVLDSNCILVVGP
jgi:hypothetical protein